MFLTLKRAFLLSLSNLRRNLFLSIATIMIIGVILFIFNIIITVNQATNSAIEILNAKVDIITYLKDDADSLEINDLINELKEFPEIKDVIYTSKETALENILKEYPGSQDPFTKYGLPNKLPANIRIITSSPTDHPKIISFLQNGRYSDLLQNVDNNLENQLIARQLVKVTAFTKQILWAIIFAFLLSGLFVILNSIHLAIYHRQKEIQIMKLVGAKYSFIHLPFIIEGIIYGLLGAVLNFLLFILFLQKTGLITLALPDNSFPFSFLVIFEFTISILLGILSSLIAVYKYLK